MCVYLFESRLRWYLIILLEWCERRCCGLIHVINIINGNQWMNAQQQRKKSGDSGEKSEKKRRRKTDKGATSKQRMSLHFMNMCVGVRACFYLCIYKLTTAKISKFSNLSFSWKCVFLFEGKKIRRKDNFVIRAIRRYPVNHQNKFNFTLCCIFACAHAMSSLFFSK